VTLKAGERRHAQRFPLPKKAPATFGGFAADIVEISLTGCQIEHTDRIAPKAHLPLKFKWRGSPVKVDATVLRSEMRSIGGKPGYSSGLAFCDTPAESPGVVRDIVGWLAEAAKNAMPQEPVAAPAPAKAPAPAPAPAPAVKQSVQEVPFVRVADEDDAELVSAPYLQCILSAGQWDKIFVENPQQPSEGFTIVAPLNDAEADVLCRAYQAANGPKRREMRASFEKALRAKT
jgi:hypothetical protein